MLFSSEQVNRGKKIVNTGTIILILLLLADFTLSLVSNGTKGLTGKIFISGMILFNIFLYYKGNRIAFKVTMFLLSGVYIFIFGLLPVHLVLGLLRMLNILDAYGGALYLVVPVIIITAVSILVFKTGFYEDVLAFKNYYDKIYKTRK
ncbi:hypothetical protein Q2T46_13655 [Thermoanaerobacterium sp. CMT5567-10]|uniref:hypothetical protein n=1 Tax=Thermoanaerobacterium sp. CMT5567-10 TaxID=3061989 RepID=UPI0026DF1F84|nr:hypothetical protein [Thermoanaerobacterium sp. CMT5567-10]WKV08559.1 hypothetical protein Q2T46_13655 [Thermoanaerobacterium sp. CMT5567-10]